MIKIHLQKVNRGLIFQILEMPEGMRGMDTYVASNGMHIASVSYPSLPNPDAKIIYVIGDSPSEDHDITVQQYHTNDTRDQQYDLILRALNEFVHSEVYERLMHKPTEQDGEYTLTFG